LGLLLWKELVNKPHIEVAQLLVSKASLPEASVDHISQDQWLSHGQLGTTLLQDTSQELWIELDSWMKVPVCIGQQL